MPIRLICLNVCATFRVRFKRIYFVLPDFAHALISLENRGAGVVYLNVETIVNNLISYNLLFLQITPTPWKF